LSTTLAQSVETKAQEGASLILLARNQGLKQQKCRSGKEFH